MSLNRRVGIYLRLSREDENRGESSSITNQRAILLDYIKKNNLEYVDEYVDDGVSGTTFDRAGFKRMLGDINNKKIDMVITKDTSRLGRDHIEFGFYVEKYFPEHHVRYVAVCDDIDTDNNHNDMLLFKSAYNDMYVRDISNKIRASLDIKKRNGEFVGAYAPYGYSKSSSDRHKLVIDDKAAFVVRRIYNLFLKGYSVTGIRDILTKEGIETPSSYKKMKRLGISCQYGIWNTRTITDILTNPTYIGNLAQGRCRKVNYKSKLRVHVSREDWIVKVGACPKIVDEDIFERVQKMYQKNKYKKQDYYSNNLLFKGLVYCYECGHKIGFRKVMSVNKCKDTIFKYYGNCNYYLKNKKYHLCTPHSISYQEFESVVVSNIFLILKNINKDKLISRLKKYFQEKMLVKVDKKRIINLDRELKLLEVKRENLYEDKISNFIDKDLYLKMKMKIDGEWGRVYDEYLFERSKVRKGFNIDLDKFLKDKLGKIDCLLVNMLIDKITLDENGKIKIYYDIKNEEFEGISCDSVTQ